MNIIFGYLLIFSAFIIALIYLIRKLPKPGLAITVCFLMVFTGIFIIIQERATEIVLDRVGTIKMAAQQSIEDSKEIAIRKAEIDTVAKDLFKLKAKLDSIFTSDPEGIKFKKDLGIDKLESATDGGLINVINHPLSTSSTTEGGTFSVGGSNILQYSGTGDGAGGIINKKVGCLSNLEIINPDNGVIMTSTNGTKWLLQMKNSGQLDITKF